MSKPTTAGNTVGNFPFDKIDGFNSLVELALDLRWSWNHATDEVWRKPDSYLWEVTHNSWANRLDTALVQLYANAINGGAAECVEMNIAQLQSCVPGYRTYHATSSSERPARDYTPRIIPNRPGVAIPLECAHILWQK